VSKDHVGLLKAGWVADSRAVTPSPRREIDADNYLTRQQLLKRWELTRTQGLGVGRMFSAAD
jgi:hypothetical protein